MTLGAVRELPLTVITNGVFALRHKNQKQMRYLKITHTPKSTEGYFKIPHNDNRDEYIADLVRNLCESSSSVCTGPVAIAWVEAAVQEIPEMYSHYTVSAVVLNKRTTGFGEFYFDLLK